MDKRARFELRFVGKAEEIVPDWFENRIGDIDINLSRIKKDVDVVVVDPPRKGCDEKLLETIIKMRPKKMIYVSCDPATLARDIKILGEGGYAVEKVTPVDMFPGSMHVESVALLERVIKAKDHA